MNPRLSLVTGTVNRRTEFLRLVDSIRRNTDVPYELIVADGSDDPIYTENLGDDVHVMLERPRLGYVKGYNAAFRQASGEWVIWLNDDAEVLPGYASKAISYMETRPHVGLGCLAFRDRLWPHKFEVCSMWGIPYANFGIIRRTFGNDLGWFWEGLTMYGSDNALTFDVLLAGKAVAEIHGEFIHHHRPDDLVRHQNQNRRREDNRRLEARYQPKLKVLRRLYVSGSVVCA